MQLLPTFPDPKGKTEQPSSPRAFPDQVPFSLTLLLCTSLVPFFHQGPKGWVLVWMEREILAKDEQEQSELKVPSLIQDPFSVMTWLLGWDCRLHPCAGGRISDDLKPGYGWYENTFSNLWSSRLGMIKSARLCRQDHKNSLWTSASPDLPFWFVSLTTVQAQSLEKDPPPKLFVMIYFFLSCISIF